MKAQVAQLAGDGDNADRTFTADHYAIVLDGASAFLPVDVDPGTYASTLGTDIAHQLDDDTAVDLPAVVRTAITRTAERLDLTPSRSPSSTVAILRTRENEADLYVLGDSPIHYGTNQHVDRLDDLRLARIAPAERRHYQERLRAGHGYDDQHRELLATLQRAQREARNTHGGYWIAEADPAAADHGITRTLAANAITWAVLASDGATDIVHLAGRSWHDIAHADSDDLAALLAQLNQWETNTDPDGRVCTRAKRHDDKTLVAIDRLW